MEQVQPVPKRSDQYTAEERAKFPRLFRFPENHFVEWEKPVGLYERYFEPGKEPK